MVLSSSSSRFILPPFELAMDGFPAEGFDTVFQTLKLPVSNVKGETVSRTGGIQAEG